MLAEPRAARPRRFVRVALAVLLVPLAILAALWFTLPDPAGWSRSEPTTTALIEQRRAEARAAGRRYQPVMAWVPLERLPRRLADAVVASEDAKFFVHGGFDWEALREAFRLNLSRRRYVRGASTITQQLAKNLYLGTEKSLLRKAREALLTVKLERRLGKRRILALYLNVAEWGDGVFGAEAAARRYFATGAGSLSTAQAILLASMLPAPRRASLSPAPGWLAARARGLLDRLLAEGVIPAAEHDAARLELERYLGAVPPARPGEEEEPPPDEAASAPPQAGPAPAEPPPAPVETPVREPEPAGGPSPAPPAEAAAPEPSEPPGPPEPAGQPGTTPPDAAGNAAPPTPAAP